MWQWGVQATGPVWAPGGDRGQALGLSRAVRALRVFDFLSHVPSLLGTGVVGGSGDPGSIRVAGGCVPWPGGEQCGSFWAQGDDALGSSRVSQYEKWTQLPCRRLSLRGRGTARRRWRDYLRGSPCLRNASRPSAGDSRERHTGFCFCWRKGRAPGYPDWQPPPALLPWGPPGPLQPPSHRG